jgi:hypothetical protein
MVQLASFQDLEIDSEKEMVFKRKRLKSPQSQVLNENARKPLSIGYLAFSLCSDILAALSVF